MAEEDVTDMRAIDNRQHYFDMVLEQVQVQGVEEAKDGWSHYNKS